MDSTKRTQISGSEEDSSYLKEFNLKNAAVTVKDFEKMGLSAEEYKQLWTTLLNVLQDVSPDECSIYLTTIRILSRDRDAVCRVTEKDHILVLVELAGLQQETSTAQQNTKLQQKVSLEACQCLSNLTYQSQFVQSVFCTSVYLGRQLRNLEQQQSHLLTVALLRLIFLTTAFQPHLRREAVDRHNALRVLVPLLDVRRSLEGATDAAPTMQAETVERVIEVMKALYNICFGITATNSDDNGACLTTIVADSSLRSEDEQILGSVVTCVRHLLLSTAHTHEHTQLMHSHCINMMVCVPATSLCLLVPPSADRSWWGAGQQRKRITVHKGADVTALVQILAFLHARLNAEACQQTVEKLSPVLTMLVNACQSNRCCRHFVRQRVMPPLRDVTHRPEEGNSLRSRLVKLMTSPNIELKHLSATLLFILCNHSVDRLIKYTGYGNCAGLLASLGLLAGANDPEDQNTDSEDSDTEEYDRVKHMVNPVTGCYEPVKPNPLDNMTEEQREYETMKLVNALDKLIRTGNIKPCSVGADGRPQPLEHVLQLQDTPVIPAQVARANDQED